jgi:hypothetical protein
VIVLVPILGNYMRSSTSASHAKQLGFVVKKMLASRPVGAAAGKVGPLGPVIGAKLVL